MTDKTIQRPFGYGKKMFLAIFVLGFSLLGTRSFGQSAPWVAPKDADNIKNPVAASPAGISSAKTLYVGNCSPCHGDKGKGDGPAAPGLNPKPADHTSALVQSESDGSLFWKLSEGRNPMPTYKQMLSETQRWQLVNYIRTLKKK